MKLINIIQRRVNKQALKMHLIYIIQTRVKMGLCKAKFSFQKKNVKITVEVSPAVLFP
uniref:Uncharacterized protein n=1 Tax=Arundo donax TaxID=35708 RepID=A0A0A9BIK4_ARUDO